jgi:hypothetical protein
MRATILGLLGLLGVLAACGDSTGTGSPGTLVVSLESPNTDDGAVAVSVTGTGLTSAAPVGSSVRVFWRLVSETEIQVIVFGNLTAGPLFSVNVGDVRHPDRYSGDVTQVAARSDALRDDISGYAIRLTRAESP